MRTSCSAATFTTAPRTRSTAATTGVLASGEVRGRRGGKDARAGDGGPGRTARARASRKPARTVNPPWLRCRPGRSHLVLVVVQLVEVVRVEIGLDRHRLIGEVGQRLHVLLVLLLVDPALLEVSLHDPLVDELTVDVVRHESPWGWLERAGKICASLRCTSSACYRTARERRSPAGPRGPARAASRPVRDRRRRRSGRAGPRR